MSIQFVYSPTIERTLVELFDFVLSGRIDEREVLHCHLPGASLETSEEPNHILAGLSCKRVIRSRTCCRCYGWSAFPLLPVFSD
jgi:hypothetical protein